MDELLDFLQDISKDIDKANLDLNKLEKDYSSEEELKPKMMGAGPVLMNVTDFLDVDVDMYATDEQSNIKKNKVLAVKQKINEIVFKVLGE